MSIHICIPESLVAGGDNVIVWCPVCCEETKHTIGYVGGLCGECGFLHTGDWDQVVIARRKRLGLSRKEIAELYGCLPRTIATYENWWPPEKYVNFTEKLVKAQANGIAPRNAVIGTRKWRDLRDVEKDKIKEFIISFWQEKGGNKIEVDFGYRKVVRSVTYESVIVEVKERFDVKVSYYTVAKIIRENFEKREPKVFIPDKLSL